MKKSTVYFGLLALLLGTAGALAQTPVAPCTTFSSSASGATIAGCAPASAANPLATIPLGGGSLATGQVSVGTTATLIAPARAGRQSLLIVNEGTTVVRVGTASVATGTGAYLAGTAGQTLRMDTSGAVYGIVGSGTQTVSFVEIY